MKKAKCVDCGHLHGAGMVRNVEGVRGHGPGWRARYAGSPVRESKPMAVRDMCRFWQQVPGQQALDLGGVA